MTENLNSKMTGSTLKCC